MVYAYTKPRGPIAAQYNSPGPIYMLPPLVGKKNHDPTSPRRSAPAWQFGVRHSDNYRKDGSPGPVYYPDQAGKVTRRGKDGTPSYSLYGRPRDLSSFKGPGPGAYNPQNTGINAPHGSPKYSFGMRTRNRGTDSNPGPDKYLLPPLIGNKPVEGNIRKAPSYHISSRSNTGGFHEDLQKTPGPGTYTVTAPGVYKRRGPVYTLTGRNSMPGDNTQKPGPGTYNPQTVHFDKKTAPQFSFGIRHSEYTAPLIVEATD